MAQIYYDNDANLDLLRSVPIAIVGYGSQGKAQAQNLRDSGCDVRVGLHRDSRSWPRAEADGFTTQTVAEVSAWASVVSLLLPDQLHRRVYQESIRHHLIAGKLLMVAHGFSVRFRQVAPPPEADVALVAPISEGGVMRRLFTEGVGVPAAVAVAQNASGQALEIALAYAKGIGCTRAGALLTTFEEETETDLFGEQAVLCGGLTELIKAGYDTLVAAGYQPELAYFECLHQVKLIVDLIHERGLAGMFDAISDTAEYGAYLSGPRVVDAHVRDAMQAVLAEIRDGTFARRWIAEWDGDQSLVKERRAADRESPLEHVRGSVRRLGSGGS